MGYIQDAGRYTVTVKDVDFGESKEKKTPFLGIAFETDGGDGIEANLYFGDVKSTKDNKTSTERVVNMLRTVFGFDDNFETIHGQLVGKRCSITVELEEHNGKEYARVKWINAERSRQPIADEKNFLAQLSAKAARIARPAGLPPPQKYTPPPAPPAEAQGNTDEDVPF